MVLIGFEQQNTGLFPLPSCLSCMLLNNELHVCKEHGRAINDGALAIVSLAQGNVQLCVLHVRMSLIVIYFDVHRDSRS